jgi:hypothetical protein
MNLVVEDGEVAQRRVAAAKRPGYAGPFRRERDVELPAREHRAARPADGAATASLVRRVAAIRIFRVGECRGALLVNLGLYRPHRSVPHDLHNDFLIIAGATILVVIVGLARLVRAEPVPVNVKALLARDSEDIGGMDSSLQQLPGCQKA